jgi:hypothetical protein
MMHGCMKIKYMEVTLYVPVLVQLDVKAVVYTSFQKRICRNVIDTQQEILFSLPKYDNMTM